MFCRVFLEEIFGHDGAQEGVAKVFETFVTHLIYYAKSHDKHSKFRSIGGNAFEAFTGAIFLDRGYKFTYKIIVDRIIKIHLDLDEIEKSDGNYKSRILEWSQKNKHQLEFKHSDTKGEGFEKLYYIKLFIDEKEYSEACDYSIKGAEQLAAEKAWHIIEEDNEQTI